MKVSVLFLGILHFMPLYAYGTQVRIIINHTVPVETMSKMSPSIALGMGIFKYGWTKYLDNAKLLTLVRALGPSYLRIGGTKSDHSHFILDGEYDRSQGQHSKKYRRKGEKCKGEIPNQKDFDEHRLIAYQKEHAFDKGNPADLNVTYTSAEFDELLTFVQCTGLNIIFGLNLLTRDGDSWDPSNAIRLLKYAKSKRYRIDWELGNEPNSYYHTTGWNISAVQVAKAFNHLYNILRTDAWWRNSKLIGPDVNGFYKAHNRQYLKTFLKNAGSFMDEVTFHQYYIDSRTATVDNFTDPQILNKLLPQVKKAVKIARKWSYRSSVWLGETSSSFGGGAEGLSDTYVAGFMWLDKLGLCSRNGIDVVFRQTLFESNYGLLDDNFDPRPDYWLTLLYKKLVGERVLDVTLIGTGNRLEENRGRIRVYAHCTNIQSSHYAAGAITVYYLNLSMRNKTLSIAPSSKSIIKTAEVYILTSSSSSLNSSEVYLNGNVLQMNDVHTLPEMKPIIVHFDDENDVNVPGMSFGFLVLPNANAPACIPGDNVDNYRY